MPNDPVAVFTKDGEERTAYTPDEAVDLEFYGWARKGSPQARKTAAKKAANKRAPRKSATNDTSTSAAETAAPDVTPNGDTPPDLNQ